MKRVSLLVKSFRPRIHLSVFRYRLVKNKWISRAEPEKFSRASEKRVLGYKGDQFVYQ